MFFKRKKKQLPPPSKTVPLKKKASPKTKAALDFFNGKKSAVDLLEADKRRKFVHSGYTKTWFDHTLEWIEKQPWGNWLLLALATAFVVAVAYWGITQ